jgi:hypothetical protein
MADWADRRRINKIDDRKIESIYWREPKKKRNKKITVWEIRGHCHINHHLFIGHLKRRNGKNGAKRIFEVKMAGNKFDGRH